MPEVRPIVGNVSVGNATVAIDCVVLNCIQSVNFRKSMEEVPIICDWANGPETYLRGNPTGEATINAMNLNATILKYALDAVVSTKAAPETVTCEEHTITWIPEDIATPTEWTATIILNSPEIASVTVWTDNACSATWESAATPLSTIAISSPCQGVVLLTTNDIDETDTTLYFAYTHDTETPIGATLIQSSMGTYASDHKLHILHREASTGNLVVHKFWRVQIIPDVTIEYDNTNKIVTVPIKLRILADRVNHPDAPIGLEVIIPFADSDPSDFTYDVYKAVRSFVP